MNNVFFDSNILIYLYSLDEQKKAVVVRELMDEYASIYISTQVIFEFIYVMTRKFKLKYDDIIKILDELDEAFYNEPQKLDTPDLKMC